MDKEDFKLRTKQLALRVIRLVEALPQTQTAEVIGKQLICSATSVGANYRSACRSKLTPDIIAKLNLVAEKADESLYWMELIVELGLLPVEKVSNLMSENTEIMTMTISSIKTLRNKSKIHNLKYDYR